MKERKQDIEIKIQEEEKEDMSANYSVFGQRSPTTQVWY